MSMWWSWKDSPGSPQCNWKVRYSQATVIGKVSSGGLRKSGFMEATAEGKGLLYKDILGRQTFNISNHLNFQLIHPEDVNLDITSGQYSNESLTLEPGDTFGPSFSPSKTLREN